MVLVDSNCQICPRLAHFRESNRIVYPDFFNCPVPSFGSPESSFLIVGLAPGLKGANATGRPFTGDWAGQLLYESLCHFGFASGHYEKSTHDSLYLENCRITNAVRCVPPANLPTPLEGKNCAQFLHQEIKAMTNLKVILALGRFAHDSIISIFNLKKSAYPFSHSAIHRLPTGLYLLNSYHCSRLNTNTGRLTETMFRDVIEKCKNLTG
jgi:uracil-DNA glycosylase family 4